MRTVFLASLRTHSRRYVAAAIAVIVGVAFVVVIGVLTAGARSGLMDGFGKQYRNADHVISGLESKDAIALAERYGDNAAAIGRAGLPIRADGTLIPDAVVGPLATSETLRWQELSSGRFPAGTGEAVVDVWVAQDKEIAVGDRIRIGDDDTAADIRVVGLVTSPSTGAQAGVYVTWPQMLQWRDRLHVGSLAVRGEVGQLPAGAKVASPEQYVSARRASLNRDVDVVSLMLVVFAGVALFVSVLVISNTFSILFAQRLRDFALLRCVGATRRQVVRSVRREAAAVGVLASAAGVVVGVGLGYGLATVINAVADDVPMGAAPLPVPWLLGGFAAGLMATMVASWLPTRRVVRVSPLAALRPATAVDGHVATSRARTLLATSLLVAGLALLGAAVFLRSAALMVAGGGSVFAGVLFFGPVLIPRLIRITGTLLGPAGRLATKNAVRNPRRTATTTASLLVGITLTTAALTGLATASTGVTEEVDTRHPLDAALTAQEKPFGADVLNRVRGTPGVERAMPVDGAVATVSGLDAPLPVVAGSAAARVARDGGAFARMAPGTLGLDRESLSPSSGLRVGDRVAVRVGDRETELKVVAGWGPAGLVAPETLATLTDAAEPYAIWIRATSDADPLALAGALDELADPIDATVDASLQARSTKSSVETQLGVLTWSVLGLLGIAVAIALIGIANTLGLSVLERAREHAMLRALGLTRRQLRRLLAAEAVLLSVVATLLGTVIGVGFGWAGYETVVKPALAGATMQFPWVPLGGVVLLSALAGLVAGVLPARRAARVTPAAGLSLD